MIYITGDTHGELGRFFGPQRLPDDSLTEEDYLIVAGDFGFVFQQCGTPYHAEERAALDALEEKPYTILFVDGNHENFDRLASEFPEEDWHGGRVRRIRRNVLHLLRGYVYGIDGRRVFAMGGGYSHDRATRREGFDWWCDEMPSNEEYRRATRSLAEHQNRVDLIVTHTAPDKVLFALGKAADPHEAELTGFLQWVMDTVSFDRWFFGHWHLDERLTGIFAPFTAVHCSLHPLP